MTPRERNIAASISAVCQPVQWLVNLMTKSNLLNIYLVLSNLPFLSLHSGIMRQNYPLKISGRVEFLNLFWWLKKLQPELYDYCSGLILESSVYFPPICTLVFTP